MRPFSPPAGTYGACHDGTARLRHPHEASFIVRFEARPSPDACADVATMITHLHMLMEVTRTLAEAEHREEFTDARADAKKLLRRLETARQHRGAR